MMLNLTYRPKPTRSDRVIIFLLDVGFFLVMVVVYGGVANDPRCNVKKTTLEEYDRRFDLDGEGGDMLGETAQETSAWLAANENADPVLRRTLENWLWLTGFKPCPCPSCKGSRGELLLPYEADALAGPFLSYRTSSRMESK